MKPLLTWLAQRLRRSLPRRPWAAVTTAVLTLAAAGLLLTSYSYPYWQMALDAPQFPDDLYLIVYLHGVEGDVWDIDILNKHIGMKPIETAAQLERRLSLPGLTLIAVLLILSLFAGRFTAWLKLPGILFPVFFVGMMAYFLYDYGHDLNPRAPIKIEPFMPGLLGERKIAQFTTHSSFELGFFLALAAAGLLLLTLLIGALGQARPTTAATAVPPSPLTPQRSPE